MKRLPPPTTSFDEDALLAGDSSLREGRSWNAAPVLFAVSKGWLRAAALALCATTSAAQPLRAPAMDNSDIILIALLILIVMASSSLAVLCDRSLKPRTSSTTTPTSSPPTRSSTTPTTSTPVVPPERSTYCQIFVNTSNDGPSTASSSTTPMRQTLRNEAGDRAIWSTRDGKRYHRGTCIYAQGGKKYLPCAFCNP